MKKSEKGIAVKGYLCIGLFTVLLLTIIVKNTQGTAQAAANQYDIGSKYEPIGQFGENQDLQNAGNHICVKSLERNGGIDFGEFILASESITYCIQIEEYKGAGSSEEAVSGNEPERNESADSSEEMVSSNAPEGNESADSSEEIVSSNAPEGYENTDTSSSEEAASGDAPEGSESANTSSSEEAVSGDAPEGNESANANGSEEAASGDVPEGYENTDTSSSEEAASSNEPEDYMNDSSEGVTDFSGEISPSVGLGEGLVKETDEEVKVLNYKIGNLEGTLPIQDGYAQLTIEEDTNALLQIWYAAEGMVYPIIEEYLLIDRSKPELVSEQIKKDNKQYAKIVITDQGKSISGLKECVVTMDGEICGSCEINTLNTVTWPDGECVSAQQEIVIPLEGDTLHEINVQVLDNAGNSTVETIQMQAVPDEVLDIALPESFSIKIRPLETRDKQQIYGEDIVIGNLNDFPVQVILAGVEVYVNHSVPDGGENETEIENADGAEDGLQQGDAWIKDCEIYLQLRQAGCEAVLIPLNEGMNENVLDMALSPKQPENDLTDTSFLSTDVPEAGDVDSDSLNAVDNPSCAVLNICGNLSEGSEMLWRNGDLKVTLTFQYCKLP